MGIKRTPLKRSTKPIRKLKPRADVTVGNLGRIRLKGKPLEDLRRRVFVRDDWKCRECGAPCSWANGHLAHIQSRGAGGSDTEENTRLLCGDCHRAEHGNQLPKRF